MGLKRFDRKFGAELIAGLPDTPGVYLFRDSERNVLYVGKAKNIRRRLSSYRNATRRKKHRKMRTLVQKAASLEIRFQQTDRTALAVENELIQKLRPPYNVEGTFAFLYPAIGLRAGEKRTLLCFSTSPEAWRDFAMIWYGTFRSRLRAKEAFDELVVLLGLLGHLENRASLGPIPSTPGSRIVGIRQLDQALMAPLADLLAGRSTRALGLLALQLVDKPLARRDARGVQLGLRVVGDFFHSDLRPLRSALDAAGTAESFVAQEQRDRLFIERG